MHIADTPLDSTARRTVVLDTNVVFDWLLFNDASCGSLADDCFEGKCAGTPPQRCAANWPACCLAPN